MNKETSAVEPFSLRSLILPFYLPAFIASTAEGLVIPLLPIYAGSLGAGAAAIGLVVGMRGLGGLAANIPAGRIVGRFGKRRTMILGAALEILGALVAALSENMILLGAALFLMGVAHSFFFISRLTFFRENVPGTCRGRALSLLGGEYRIGSFFGPIGGGFLAARFGFSFSFIVFCGLLTLVGFLVLMFVPPDEKNTSSASAFSRKKKWFSSGAAAMAPDRWKALATAGGAIVLLQLMRTGRQVLMPLWGEGLGLEVQQVGLFLGMMYLMEMLVFYPSGIMMDLLGRKWAAVPSFLVLACSLALLPLAHTWFLFLLVCLGAGIGNGLGSGISMTLCTDLAPRDNPGAFIGLWRFIVDCGTASGPFVVGFVTASAALGVSALTLSGAGLAGAFIMAFIVRETGSKGTVV